MGCLPMHVKSTGLYVCGCTNGDDIAKSHEVVDESSSIHQLIIKSLWEDIHNIEFLRRF